MRLKGLIFGSIGTLVETSELQRRAYQQAVDEAGLGWRWPEDTYRELLAVPGGMNRLRAYASSQPGPAPGDDRLTALHRRKSQLFREALGGHDVALRPGVSRLLREARAAGLGLGLATTTEPETVRAILERFEDAWQGCPFEAVLDRSRVEHEKPDGEVYRTCLRELGVGPDAAVAIEDTAASVAAARDAGLPCLATPGRFARGQDFSGAVAVVDALGEEGAPSTPSGAGPPLDSPFVTVGWLDRLRRSQPRA